MDMISAREQRILKGTNAKVKMPYKMFTGMRKKAIEKMKKTADTNRELDIIAESGGNKKQRLMEKVFAQREQNKKKSKDDAKRARERTFDKIMQRERSKKRQLMRSIKRDADGQNKYGGNKGAKFHK